MLDYMASFHSLDRAVERCKINRTSAERTIQLAYQKGKKSSYFNSYEKNYLLDKEARYGNIAIVYNGFCYIFSDTAICITVMKLPIWFNKRRHFYHKERIRNVKKFMKNCYI